MTIHTHWHEWWTSVTVVHRHGKSYMTIGQARRDLPPGVVLFYNLHKITE